MALRCLLAGLLLGGCVRGGFDTRLLTGDGAADVALADVSLIDALRQDRSAPAPRDQGVDLAWIQASNNVALSCVDGASAWTPGQAVKVDTDAGTVDGASSPAFRTLAQSGSGVELGVLCFSSVEIPSAVTVEVSGTRALVLVADQVHVAGTLLLTGGRGGTHLAGPGGNQGSTALGVDGSGPGGGESAPVSTTKYDGGGGGGGFGSSGGHGGADVTLYTSGGDGGGGFGSATLVPLVGGSGGGAGSPGDSAKAAAGGGGGGAVQIVGRTRVDIPGKINVGGGGGDGGVKDDSGVSGGAGGGGGSGGAILVEAPTVIVSGALCAGGGGGGGAAQTTDPGYPGQPGQLSGLPAAGGGAPGNEGPGGAGAVSNAAGAPGQNGEVNGGGGGGGAGRIRVNGVSVSVTGVTSGLLSTATLP